jgi:hypothetical protein
VITFKRHNQIMKRVWFNKETKLWMCEWLDALGDELLPPEYVSSGAEARIWLKEIPDLDYMRRKARTVGHQYSSAMDKIFEQNP